MSAAPNRTDEYVTIRPDTGTPASPSRPEPIRTRGNRAFIDKHGIRVVSNTREKSKETTEQKFRRFLEEWRRDVFGISSSTEIYSHPAYHRIISLGESAIPFILHELLQRPEHWDYALWIITEENPVKPEDAGRMDKMAEAWLEWGREHGYI